jgi:hypothetical protein
LDHVKYGISKKIPSQTKIEESVESVSRSSSSSSDSDDENNKKVPTEQKDSESSLTHIPELKTENQINFSNNAGGPDKKITSFTSLPKDTKRISQFGNTVRRASLSGNKLDLFEVVKAKATQVQQQPQTSAQQSQPQVQQPNSKKLVRKQTREVSINKGKEASGRFWRILNFFLYSY